MWKSCGSNFERKILITSEVENILFFIPIALLTLSELLVIRSKKSYVFFSGKGEQ